ncbi:probable disease resistance protein At4g27220 [Primulina eburnea]|uniref:probable disease resistance protein At4g27220 n=1 Tax=Primulina eburnea TaxID=1245227 RepID=UPI003C6C9910
MQLLSRLLVPLKFLILIIFLERLKVIAEHWISLLTEVGKCISAEGLWLPVKRHVDYWWFLEENIQGLRDEIVYLETERRNMEQSIEEARLRVESATTEVENWSREGAQKIEEAKMILQGDVDLKVWNIISRYAEGKNAKKTLEGLEKIRKDGSTIKIAYPTPPPSTVSISEEPCMEFESRRPIEEGIMDCLNDDLVRVIAICGAGGVGKTTIVQRIVDRVRKDKLFDEVVMVVVSQKIEVLKLQKEVAELLRLDLNEDTLGGRAGKLCTRLLDSKRKLIIFDDVWESFKLGAIGVPFGDCPTTCKVILTSRVRDACIRMNVQKIIQMDILTREEAWALFKEKAGSYVEGSDLRPIAKKVVEECKGLPVSLVTVGKALKDQNIHVWRDSLSQLSRSIPTDFLEVIKDVYKPLKLSYDFLENASVKSLFQLCCLFPEDYDIPIEQLTWFTIGLGMLERIRSIEEGRNRIYGFVEKLKSRFLLINGSQDYHVKMHDVVRDVAIFIGSKEKHGSLKSLEASPMDSSSKDSSPNCNRMSVDISIKNAKLPIGTDFPNLRLLMIMNSADSESSEGFEANVICFKGMEKLNVLYFSSINIVSLPQTLDLLLQLRTLHLEYCKVEDISVVGELTCLEILSVQHCDNIKELPAHIGRLNQLRVLELESCKNLERIDVGVISSLVGLEELKIIKCFDKWETEGNQSDERNAFLSELESLPNLACLEIDISECNFPQEIRLSPQLVRYRISSCGIGWVFDDLKYERNVSLTLPGDIPVANWIHRLVRSTQSLFLDGDGSNIFNLAETKSLRKLIFVKCSRVKKLVNTVDCKFPVLENLELRCLEELEEIIDGAISDISNSFQNLESLTAVKLPKLAHFWKSLNQNVSLCNLKSIHIECCPNLQYLFSVETVRSLVQLQCLKVLDCDMIEQVFWNETESNENASIIELPELKELRFSHLPNITAFSRGVAIIECPQLAILEIRYCPKLVTKFDGCPDLKTMELCSFDGLNQLLSSCCMRKWNTQFQRLEIDNYDAIQEIFWDEIEDEGKHHVIFPELTALHLSDLPCLTTFYRGVQIIKFPKLKWMKIGYLPRLNSFTPMDSESTHDHHSLHFFCSQKVEIPALKTLHLIDLQGSISNIWCRNIPISFFQNLGCLHIFCVNGIRNLMKSSIAKNLLNLDELRIERCQEMAEVIEDGKEVDATSLFPKLAALHLRSLHKLTSFCRWEHAFEFPSLIYVEIDDCPRMETFTSGLLSTPNLFWFRIDKEVVEMKVLDNGIHDHFMSKSQEGMGNRSVGLKRKRN